MKKIIPVFILIFVAILWFFDKKNKVELVVKEKTQGNLNKDRKVLNGNIAEPKKVSQLVGNQNDYKYSFKLESKDYLVSSTRKAIPKELYDSKKGKFIQESGNYVVYEAGQTSNAKYFSSALPILKNKNKPVELIYSGKLIVKEKDQNMSFTKLSRLGFKLLKRIERISVSVYQAPEGHNLNESSKVLSSLPEGSVGTWELIIPPAKLR